jgi:signal transduction histidine kinase
MSTEAVEGSEPTARGRLTAGAATGAKPGRLTSLAVAGMVAGASSLQFLAAMFVVLLARSLGYSLGYAAQAKLVLACAGVVAGLGLVVALGIAFKGSLSRRTTSLRTRSFIVIAIAVVIPSLCLSALGAWAYYRSWQTAAVLYSGQASYEALELNNEVAGLNSAPLHLNAAQRLQLTRAIVNAYGAQSHVEGAQLASLDAIRSQGVLPAWAIRSLLRRGFAIGGPKGPTAPEQAVIVAWRTDSSMVRYYTEAWVGKGIITQPTPVVRLVKIGLLGVMLIVVLGVLGAWVLSRGVVRPVRRVAEASRRLAEGEGGVTVTPQGPREIRELGRAFNDMNDKLARAQEAEQAFLLNVSHELKTPLTSIRGYAEGMDDGALPAAEAAAVIGAESNRLERLVGDLLESSRMRKSAFTVRREQVDLAVVAQDVVRRHEMTARDAGLTLVTRQEGGSLVTADHDRVLQVVSNLVENAIRCTPSPGAVTITTAPGSVTVADTGRGLTSDDLPRAFERFYLYSRYGNDRPVGTGLGLAIVKDLTGAMGGRVTVTSALGVGTAFLVELPAVHQPAEACEGSGPQPVPTSETRATFEIAPVSETMPAPEIASAVDDAG